MVSEKLSWKRTIPYLTVLSFMDNIKQPLEPGFSGAVLAWAEVVLPFHDIP